MNGLKYRNEEFYIFRSAVIYSNTICMIEFLELENIFKINGSYIFYGTVSSSFEDEYNKMILVKTSRKGFIHCLEDKHLISHEIYCDSSVRFVIPFFELNI